MTSSHDETAERDALRRRVKQMYDGLNRGHFRKCYSLIDPNLREQSKVDLSVYTEGLQAFKEIYGPVNLWYIRISLHLEASAKQRDPRPFAYVYVVWQDDRHEFHLFRERWVRHSEHWFTRVAGLTANRQEAIRVSD